MQFDFTKLSPKDCYKLLVSTVVPRPIAWVVTQSPAGVVNAAPFSFFNAVAGDPPLLIISVDGHGEAHRKDTAANIRASGQFVVNLVSHELADAMVITAIDFPPEISEVAEAGLTLAPSERVAPPRIAESPVAFECETYQTIELPGGRDLVLGRVVSMYLAEEGVQDAARRYVDTMALDLVGRMHGGGGYCRTTAYFDKPRIPLESWTSRT